VGIDSKENGTSKISPFGRNDKRSIVGILLAAGSSRRFGSNKLLHPLASNIPMAVQTAQSLLTAIPECLVVVRPDDIELKDQLGRLPLQLIDNPHHNAGMGSSIVSGVHASRDASGWVIALADMPYVPATVFAQVSQGLQQGAAIVAPYFQGRRGHPVGISAQFHEELLDLQGDQGARDILIRHAEAIQRIEVDTPGILFDIDTAMDLGNNPLQKLS
jgi:molybdenum cofactor cytidylyltransferase